ncbi:hypothetical protein [Streptomyces sp. NPDC000229]|uniref:hypothetical protein n=1 Tax=Streptomyces sp. NPDC000229 TaxID=3154247 RepID=UPI00332C94DB
MPVLRRAQLGDGFLVHRSADETELRLIDFHRGAGRPTTEQVVVDREHVGEWTVDKYGGHLAYTDEQRRVRLKRVTVPRSPLALLDTRTDAALRLGTEGARWRGHWRLSRPAASWTFTLRDAYGRVVRVLSGTDASPERDGAALRIGWEGRTADGRPTVSGPYTWSLTADPGDGTGARSLGSGSLRLAGGRSAFRDADADGLGEYYAMTTAGKLSGHRIGAGGYWVPPGQGSEHVQVGTGWNSMDAFAAPGDLTGDGRPDLPARHATTGNLHLHRSNDRAGFDPGVVIGTGWKGYRLIGAGDTDRDGHGDLLARDPSGELWRHGGTGAGTLKPRALVFRDWGAGRTDILGIGDITGDGLPDLLSRDANGKLLRNKGDGKGSFGATVTVATGRQHYRTPF